MMIIYAAAGISFAGIEDIAAAAAAFHMALFIFITLKPYLFSCRAVEERRSYTPVYGYRFNMPLPLPYCQRSAITARADAATPYHSAITPPTIYTPPLRHTPII